MAKHEYQAPRGTTDLLPEDVACHAFIEETGRALFETYGYREIRTPLFEETRLFNRSIGEVTDVVEKEMFTVHRGGENSYSFRPEGTASVARAYIEHDFHKRSPFQKFFYIGPMFRYEKPQKGRMRQFSQLGIEALGTRDPLLDAEVIQVAMAFFSRLGLQGLKARVNSIGDHQDRDHFREVLKGWFKPKLGNLCPICNERFERNVFRILDCKVKQCAEVRKGAPTFLDHLSPASSAYFARVKEALDLINCPYEVDPDIVRGFDYYTHTVFEIPYTKLGARSALCGGGRYDRLLHDLGGPELGSIGFSIGMIPTMIALEMEGLDKHQTPLSRPDTFVIGLGEKEKCHAFKLTEELRQAGLTALFDYQGKGLRAQLKLASRANCRTVVILGEDEMAKGVVTVRNLDQSEENQIAQGAELIAQLKQAGKQDGNTH